MQVLFSCFSFENTCFSCELHGKHKITRPNGNVLDGIFDNGMFSSGRITFHEGEIKFLDGTFNDNEELIDGEKQMRDHTRYNGHFEQGKLNGEHGSIIGSEKTYHGYFCDGVFQSGQLTYTQSQTRYEGRFIDDLLEGDGRVFYNDGRRIEGKFDHGQLKEGTIFFANERIEAKGTFDNGFLSGENCLLVSAEGVKQKGIFSHGKLVKGTKIYPDGGIKEGTFDNGFLGGENCLLVSAEGVKQKGIFSLGKLVKGTMTYPNGEIKEGTFEDGRLTIGIHTLDGSCYSGAFDENEKLEGDGIAVISGKETKGTFSHGKLIEGRITYQNGEIKEGTFEDGQLIRGTHILVNGNYYSGSFDGNGKLMGHGTTVISGVEATGIFEEGVFRASLGVNFTSPANARG